MSTEEETYRADGWLLVGASGEVYPAASLPVAAKHNGKTIIEVNIRPTEYTAHVTDIFLQGKAGEVLPALVSAFHAHCSIKPAWRMKSK